MAFRAKKKPAKTKKKRTKKRMPLINKEKLFFLFGLFVLLVAAYLLISFVSFLFYGAADQSIMDSGWSEFLFNSAVKAQNKGMKMGAYLSEVIMNRGFGLASFTFIYLLAITGLRILGRKTGNYLKSVWYSVICIIWFSVALGLFFNKTDAGSAIYWGGHYGFVLSNWLRSLIGVVGLVFLLFISGLAIIVVRFDGAFELMKGLLKRKPKHNEEEDISFNEESAPSELEGEESVTKVIEDDDDVVKAIFESDDEDDLPLVEQEIEIDDQIEVEETEEKVEEEIEVIPVEKEDELNLTVAPKQEEEESDKVEPEELEDYDPTLDLASFKFPTLELLEDHKFGNAEVKNEELVANKNKIVETLRHYKIEITKIRATIGPTITLYEIVPAPGVRISKIKNLEDDIALSLAALGIRIIAPIPGRGTIGIEVPNQNPETVSMHSIIRSKRFQESKAELPVALGKTISNETFMFDLVKMPHILVAGATGQGKSVGINVIITSLLYKKHPSQLKFVFIDPKKVELNIYSVLEKHYLAKLPDAEEPVITDIQKVKNTLNSINVEMDARYDLLKAAQARNIKEYNKKFISRRLNPEKGHRFMPYIVVIIDEFADLIMTAGKEIELPIARIAQLARAVGIHMIIATQRPSTNIITGVIKANFPARIAFKVASMIDSRTILDSPGANQLIGRGDMLISQGSEMTRVQCAFVDTPEVENIVEFISEQRGYPTAFLLPEFVGDDEPGPGDVDLRNRDELFDDAARIVVMNQMGSTSMIQRKFSIGYNRAGRLMDQLEAAGIVGPSEGSKARQVLLQDEYSLEQLLNNL
ncbi:DNA translocase FtsK 4TM domain-containing protein [Draconibacterium sp. IB214405]|uniref:FtsK/SpoIIIE family DNA translocase n=1 Tax=Draconibacterium sp. IB214405 TaxID=3097352 RepID=UPI002A17E0E2|nr:DNA translocase FtsK 4TM domain-containing protein [Draconibacterium sp. IB214405]MDX8339318.1 DNA translocase FtsK 4TM domain-containing protein [Draconibacterium sp. IB214405]